MTEHKRPLLRSGTTVEDIVRELADEIIGGRRVPGEKLDEPALAARFRVSRTPIRETLQQLAAMGLVDRRPNRGATVATITDETLAGMFEAMAELEAACARLAALRMTLPERKQLEALHLDAARLVAAGDRPSYERVNVLFHESIYAGSHSPYLADLVHATRSRLAPFRRAQFSVVGRLANSFDEHGGVVEAILRGDADGAAAAMRAHVSTVSAATTEFVNTHRPDTTP